MKRIVSIVGRPNVGKSTLFNRILGYKKAITEDTPGVTRDRNYSEFDYLRQAFVLIDTGGFEPSKEDGFSPLIELQIHKSIDESDMIIFVLDGKEGMLPEDRDVAKILRKSQKPVFYAINKVDSKKREQDLIDFYELGVEKFYPMSAQHGIGIDEMLEDMVKTARDQGETAGVEHEASEATLKIALVGKPNTGKSSITNRLLGADRMIVSVVPGTTRDAIDSQITFKERELLLIDTAGLRKKSKISMKVEEFSVSSAIKSIERADVVNLVIDAEEGPGHQDGSITNLIVSRGKGLCIIVNKWDLVAGAAKENEYKSMLQQRMPHASFAPVIFTSAKTGKNIDRILDADIKVYEQLTRKITTPLLNKAFEEFFARLAISFQQGKQVKVFYVSQAKTAPPTFILFSNFPKLIPEHYKRYLENSLREKFGFAGSPIRLVFKKK
ncbi:MAG TPA: ribosome biogenesis GTPase Der [Syntrophorhabdaceae bacterium]|nr:ribosome biogenesis GTPase Der [Syntrophorhabdaceae bacterium]